MEKIVAACPSKDALNRILHDEGVNVLSLMRRSNAHINATGAEHAPLLLGKVQLGTAHDDQRDLLLEELRTRGVDADVKEKITVLKNVLIENEHPNPTTNTNDKKHFLPKFLTATDWMKDDLFDALAKIEMLREERISR